MSKIKCLWSIFCTLALAAVFTLSMPGQAAAGSKPSPSTCKELGLINVNCTVCDTGERIGMVSVQAEYEPNDKDCLARYREARERCAQAYGRPLLEIGCNWSYWMGVTRYYGNYPSRCKK